MSALKSFVNWLGLGPDEGEPYAGHLGVPARGHAGTDTYGAPSHERGPMTLEPAPVVEPGGLTAVPPAGEPVIPEPTLRPAVSVARPRPPTAAVRPIVVSPGVFDEAQEVGDHFKQRQPVIVNLQDADSDLRRRLVDFAAGLCYALDGQVERVTPGVYLLTPSDVRVALEERSLTADA
ncbi:MAG: cell division protein SepF [bacterium]|nr:cell division protein SepF [bacterium]MXZ30240.1 cell division protein SepF [Acidimicrobiia bacterium]MYB23747.1 cell division protein SepF [Acidimicrobiia bacterium]MYE68081.1 cell division protein SepF [Acidimicrobiia bacterium]MYJ12839.1 cell division protein SepF [Acidimicrobiia bacterium]